MICKVDKGTELADMLLVYVENCPWVSCIFVSEEYRGQKISGDLIAYANRYLKKTDSTGAIRQEPRMCLYSASASFLFCIIMIFFLYIFTLSRLGLLT